MIARAAILFCASAALLLAGSAVAQLTMSPGVQGSQVLDQRSADFALQLRQSQQAVELQRLQPGDTQLRTEMESLHLQQRQRLDQLQGQQRLEMQRPAQQPGAPSTAGAGLMYQRERARIEERLETDTFERELGAQVREAEQQRTEESRPSLGPTLDR